MNHRFVSDSASMTSKVVAQKRRRHKQANACRLKEQSMFGNKDERQLKLARKVFEELGRQLNTPISLRLWDGSTVALGQSVEPGLEFSIKSPGVIGGLIRKPTPDNLLRHYALGYIDYHGADLVTLIEKARVKNSRSRAKKLPKSLIARAALSFATTKAEDLNVTHEYEGDETGLNRKQEENQDFIQFHYDVSNEFYQLFLDPNMLYSCAYFHDWEDSLEQAQLNKLDMICRKLQMKEDERFLDIGCGWGALVCHAADHYGVRSHGITLSKKQLAFAQEKINRLGLQDRVTVELCDYADVEGPFDKIASIGMVEHVGIDNMQAYMHKVRTLLPDRGMFLNHGITRPAKKSQKQFRKMRPEQRLLAKYIFPGGELDHIGHMVEHGSGRIRCSRRRRLARSLCVDVSALVPTFGREPRRGDSPGRRRTLPHVGSVPGRRHLRIRRWKRTDLPNRSDTPQIQRRKRNATDSRTSLHRPPRGVGWREPGTAVPTSDFCPFRNGRPQGLSLIHI